MKRHPSIAEKTQSASTVSAAEMADDITAEIKLSGVKYPPNFKVNINGVYIDSPRRDDGGQFVRVSGPLYVSRMVRNPETTGWQWKIVMRDRDGKRKFIFVPATLLHESRGVHVISMLADAGLLIVPGREKDVIAYIGLSHTDNRATSTDKLGWLPTDKLAYVLPETTIGTTSDPVEFAPERHSPVATTMQSSGTLQDWQNEIAKACMPFDYLIFALCFAFSSVLLKFVVLESGGFHFWGLSGRGKTLLLQVAASVWGCGSDPSDDPDKSYVRKWNSTANALEALAAAHSDGLLILDEIGTCAAKDVGGAIYNFSGGRGKEALDAGRKLKKARTWRTHLLSSGEKSMKEMIEEDK